MTPSNQPTILIVDDDPLLPSLLDAVLGEDYHVVITRSGEEALNQIAELAPNLVLMDINMSGIDGYEACRRIKQWPSTRQIPVIFLSGLVDLETRLAAYDAGGEDFIAKPFLPAELRAKVALTLRASAERASLSQRASEAFNTAMTAMSAAGEIGVVLQFLRHSFACRDYRELADSAIDACANYGLTVSAQVRGTFGIVNRNAAGDATANEESVLTTLSTCGRIVTLGRRAAFSFERMTLLVRDMPVEDEERCGRMRDNLALLVEGADARVRTLDAEMAVRRQRESLHRLASRTRDALNDIDERHRGHKSEAEVIMNGMLEQVESSFYSLGLTDSQEEAVASTLRQAVHRVVGLFEEGLAVDTHLRQINQDLANELADVVPAERTA